MTDQPKFDVRTIADVREALMRIPDNVATVSESSDEYEYVIDVQPNTGDKCNFTLRFSTYETYGLYFGHGLWFEDLSTTEFPATDVASAILNGQVRETLRKAGKWVIGSEGEISLDDGRTLYDQAVLPFDLQLLGKPESIVYASYR